LGLLRITLGRSSYDDWNYGGREIGKISSAFLIIISSVFIQPSSSDMVGLNNETLGEVYPEGFGGGSAGIQRTINSRKITRIIAGTYIIDATISIPSNRTIIMNKGVYLRAKTNLNAPIFTNSDKAGGNTNIYIKGGKLCGNKDNQSAESITIYFKKVSNLKLESVWVDSSSASYNTPTQSGAVLLEECHSVKLVNCSVTNTKTRGDGLYVGGGDNISVTGGNYSNNGSSGIDFTYSDYGSVTGAKVVNNTYSGISINAQYGLVKNNYVRGNKWGINIGHSTISGSHTIVTGNTVFKNTESGIQTQEGVTTDVKVIGNNSHDNVLHNYYLPATTTRSLDLKK
jgi:parallel beta-helix repeat protein